MYIIIYIVVEHTTNLSKVPETSLNFAQNEWVPLTVVG